MAAGMLPRDPREVPAMKPSDRSLAQVRKNNILKLVSTRGSATVSELCEHFGVSPATIRNDLRELEASQLIERTHGGAMRSGKAAFEPDNDVKSVHRVHEKAAIARAALRYIKPRDIISLDTGTTTYQLAMLLGSIEQLTVVTCDLQIAAWLESNTDVNLILVGGQVRHGFHCTGGQTAIELLSRLHVDKAFIAANAVDANGPSTPTLEVANIKTALVRSADRVILLADASKLGRSSFVTFAGLDAIDTIITSRDAEPERLKAFAAAGVKVCMTP